MRRRQKNPEFGVPKETRMKIAFTTSGNDLNSLMDRRFGRAPRFLLFDLVSEMVEVIDNQQNLNVSQGAGIQSAEKIARQGARALVTGHCGPKAAQALAMAGIRIYCTDAATVGEALDLYRAGGLSETVPPDVERQWA